MNLDAGNVVKLNWAAILIRSGSPRHGLQGGGAQDGGVVVPHNHLI